MTTYSAMKNPFAQPLAVAALLLIILLGARASASTSDSDNNGNNNDIDETVYKTSNILDTAEADAHPAATASSPGPESVISDGDGDAAKNDEDPDAQPTRMLTPEAAAATTRTAAPLTPATLDLAEAEIGIESAPVNAFRAAADVAPDTLSGKTIDDGLAAAEATDCIETESNQAVFESKLRLQRALRRDRDFSAGLFLGSSSELPTLMLFDTSSQSKPKRVISLVAGTTVRPSGTRPDRFVVDSGKRTVTLQAADVTLRNAWVAAIRDVLRVGSSGDDGDISSSSSSNSMDFVQLGRGRVTENVGLQKFRPRELSIEDGPRELSIGDGPVLKLCAVRLGAATASCQQMPLDKSPVDVYFDKEREDGRSVFRVTTHSSIRMLRETWELDAGSPEAREAWVALLKETIREARADIEKWKHHEGPIRAKNPGDFLPDPVSCEQLGSPFQHPHAPLLGIADPPAVCLRPAFRGGTLSSKDGGLRPGQFLSTMPVVDSTNLEITEVGDVVLRHGDWPDSSMGEPPIWAHRATEPISGKAKGGLRGWLSSSPGGKRGKVFLAVKNGRWEIRRGYCVLEQSPKPTGSWRVYLPWDKRGRAIKAATLQLRDDDTVVVASGDEVFWSSPPPRSTGGLEEEKEVVEGT